MAERSVLNEHEPCPTCGRTGPLPYVATARYGGAVVKEEVISFSDIKSEVTTACNSPEHPTNPRHVISQPQPSESIRIDAFDYQLNSLPSARQLGIDTTIFDRMDARPMPTIPPHSRSVFSTANPSENDLVRDTSLSREAFPIYHFLGQDEKTLSSASGSSSPRTDSFANIIKPLGNSRFSAIVPECFNFSSLVIDETKSNRLITKRGGHKNFGSRFPHNQKNHENEVIGEPHDLRSKLAGECQTSGHSYDGPPRYKRTADGHLVLATEGTQYVPAASENFADCYDQNHALSDPNGDRDFIRTCEEAPFNMLVTENPIIIGEQDVFTAEHTIQAGELYSSACAPTTKNCEKKSFKEEETRRSRPKKWNNRKPLEIEHWPLEHSYEFDENSKFMNEIQVGWLTRVPCVLTSGERYAGVVPMWFVPPCSFIMSALFAAKGQRTNIVSKELCELNLKTGFCAARNVKIGAMYIYHDPVAESSKKRKYIRVMPVQKNNSEYLCLHLDRAKRIVCQKSCLFEVPSYIPNTNFYEGNQDINSIPSNLFLARIRNVKAIKEEFYDEIFDRFAKELHLGVYSIFCNQNSNAAHRLIDWVHLGEGSERVMWFSEFLEKNGMCELKKDNVDKNYDITAIEAVTRITSAHQMDKVRITDCRMRAPIRQILV